MCCVYRTVDSIPCFLSFSVGHLGSLLNAVAVFTILHVYIGCMSTELMTYFWYALPCVDGFWFHVHRYMYVFLVYKSTSDTVCYARLP